MYIRCYYAVGYYGMLEGREQGDGWGGGGDVILLHTEGYGKFFVYYFDGLSGEDGWAVIVQSGSGRGSNQEKIVFNSERISSLKDETAVTLGNFLRIFGFLLCTSLLRFAYFSGKQNLLSLDSGFL